MSDTPRNPPDKNTIADISMLDNQHTARQLLEHKQAELAGIDKITSPIPWAKTLLDCADALNELQQKAEAWQAARDSFEVFLQQEAWQEAVEACNVMYQTEQANSVSALGQGLWLAITYPIEADTTVVMLHHVVDDTPKDADGAAVAAATAHYIANLRASGQKQQSLAFLTTHVLGQVAKRHSGVESQEQFDMWLARLQLDKPEVLLPRMAKIIDAMVGRDWWFDRDELRARLPIN